MRAAGLVSMVLLLVACGPSRGRDGRDGTGDSTGGTGGDAGSGSGSGDGDGGTAATCGNGRLDPGEGCDPRIIAGPGVCPAGCDDGDPCTTDSKVGSAADCTLACRHAPVQACTTGDGCCPNGCSHATDLDCGTSCGNGIVDPGETCDGDCPSSCDDGDACTTDILSGSSTTCTAHCSHSPVNRCAGGDGCCPPGCSRSNDSDCAPADLCGNGVVDPGETCDGDCPTQVAQCSDGNLCTQDGLTGSASTCTAKCTWTPVSTCRSGDGCCPAGCTFANDHDCPGCGNGVIDPGETCDGSCPASAAACNDGNACTIDGVTGSASTCTARCTYTDITTCQNGDGCCPAGCGTTNDSDCVAKTCSPACGAGQHCDPNTGTCVTDPPPVGKACTSDADCGSGVCFIQAESGWPGGMCVASCLTDADCGSGNHCEGGDGFFNQGVCAKGCTTNADCRSGYACYDHDHLGFNVCGPVGTGTRAVGAPCSSTLDCAGGNGVECLTGPGYGFDNGYCVRAMASGGTCPPGSHLTLVDAASQWGLCYADCTGPAGTASSCRSGYLCYDADGNGSLECAPGSLSGAAFGSTCTLTAQCAGGTSAMCFSSSKWSGGLCTLRCSGHGPTAACPANATCIGFNDGNSYCLQTCTSTCPRSGYTCQDLLQNGTMECYPP